MCYGDTGYYQHATSRFRKLCNCVASDEQLERFKGTWAAMATPSRVVVLILLRSVLRQLKMAMTIFLNGEKIFVTSGERADSAVVWATLDRKLGRAAIKSFVVPKGTPGMKVERLEHVRYQSFWIQPLLVLLTVVFRLKTCSATLKLMLQKVLPV